MIRVIIVGDNLNWIRNRAATRKTFRTDLSSESKSRKVKMNVETHNIHQDSIKDFSLLGEYFLEISTRRSHIIISNIFPCSGQDAQDLINAAIEVRKLAYCPYSGFKVGAAIRTSTGQIFTGCNVENGAYTPSICAERTAICKAVSEGHKDFAAVAVVAHQEETYTTPCGVCRQFLSEFTPKDIPVYVAKPAPARVFVTSVHSLLPFGFVPVKNEDNSNFSKL